MDQQHYGNDGIIYIYIYICIQYKKSDAARSTILYYKVATFCTVKPCFAPMFLPIQLLHTVPKITVHCPKSTVILISA